jgi:hypothetical protein
MNAFWFDQGKLPIENGNVMLTLIARRSRHYAGTRFRLCSFVGWSALRIAFFIFFKSLNVIFRYLKRGVNAKGRVANDVETEQLISDETGQITSVVQHRGSIPLYWSQETSVMSIKPDIICMLNLFYIFTILIWHCLNSPVPVFPVHRKDVEYKATELHFQNLAARYGNPIVVLNLVKVLD